MKRFILLLLMMTFLTACTAQADVSPFDLTFTDRELAGTWDTRSAVSITGSVSTCSIAGKGAALTDGVLTISSEGVYVLSGEFSDIPILVSAGEKDKVQLVLQGATITVSEGPAIYVETADKVFLTAAPDTMNTISDGSDYTLTKDSASLDGAIFSRADLCINGSGSLTVMGSFKHGIVSKDDLVIVGVSLSIQAVSTALHGKDCVMLSGVTGNLIAGSNGIRSDNTEDADRGYVYLLNSSLSITAGKDGIQAESLLRLDQTTLTITTGEGSGSVRTASEPWGFRSGRSQNTTDAASMKGLKSAADIEINGGTIAIDAQDDCIHANGNLVITGGTFRLSSGDDGIHADNHLLISGGEITISQSYEGIEASKLEITGGTISIIASDDGLNAAGGADGSAAADRWGRGMFSNMVGEILISGGYIHINASGDGIDSNNSIAVSGGVTLVTGSANSANAAFDYDGKASVTGGILFATGGSGMAQSFSSAENQGCMLFGINGAQAGVSIAIVDNCNQVVASFTPENGYSAVVVTAPGLQVGNTYSIVLNAAIEGADSHGFAADAAFSGGTNIGSIKMTTLLQGGSGHGMGGPGGGGRKPGR